MARKLFAALAFVALAGSLAVSSADDAAKGKSHADAHSPEAMMASCLAVGNQEEIIMAEFGRKKAQSDEVKKFAEMMVTDHHAFLVKLKKFAPEATQPGYLNSDVKAAKAKGADDKETKVVIKQTAADDADNKVETAVATSSDAPKHMDFMAMQKEMANECIAQSREMLSKKSGAEFDHCFIGHQLGMHFATKVKLTVFKRHASGEFASILDEGLKTTEEHLAKAEKLMKELEHKEDKGEKVQNRKERREEKAETREEKTDAAKEKE